MVTGGGYYICWRSYDVTAGLSNGKEHQESPFLAYRAEVTSLGKVTFLGSPFEEGLRQEAGEQGHIAEASQGRERGARGSYNSGE